MPTYIQIDDDPTKWWLVEPFNATQLTGQPLILELSGPLHGTLVLSGRSASVALFYVPDAAVPENLNPSVGAIYLPTSTGASAQHYGYELLPALDVESLASQIATAMRDGTRQNVPLESDGMLVLDGATLSFVVIQIPAPIVPVKDSTEHG
jgi:hypothetical protein